MSHWKGREMNAVDELALRGVCDQIMTLTNYSKPITAPPGFVSVQAQWFGVIPPCEQMGRL